MGWYVIHTKPRQEELVVSRLTELALEVFLPRIQVRRRRRAMRTSTVEPLFPGYLFVSVELSLQVWAALRWTPGVKAVVGCDGVPSPIPDALIAVIRQRVGSDGVIQPQAPFVQGDRVRITAGPFTGLVGVLERVTSRSGRVQVLLDMLRAATVELEDVDLELVS